MISDGFVLLLLKIVSCIIQETIFKEQGNKNNSIENRKYPYILFLYCKQISFSKDGSIPEVGAAVIGNQLLSEAVLESMIGKHGVSPAAKQNLATRLSELLKQGAC